MLEHDISRVTDALSAATEMATATIQKHASGGIAWSIPARETPDSGDALGAYEPESIVPDHVPPDYLVSAAVDTLGRLFFRAGQDRRSADRLPGLITLPEHTRPIFETLNQHKDELGELVHQVPQSRRYHTLKKLFPENFNRLRALSHWHLLGEDTVEVRFNWRRIQYRTQYLNGHEQALEYLERHWSPEDPEDYRQQMRATIRGLPRDGRFVMRFPRPPEPEMAYYVHADGRYKGRVHAGTQRASLPALCFGASPDIKPLRDYQSEDRGHRHYNGHFLDIHTVVRNEYVPVIPRLKMYYIRPTNLNKRSA